MDDYSTLRRRIERTLNGQTVGTAEGRIICDGCHAGRDLAHGHGSEPDPHSDDFLAYVSEDPRAGFKADRIWCEDCTEPEIGEGTEGVDEAMVRVTVEFIGLSRPPCQVIEADVLDLNPADGAEASAG